MSTYGDSVVAPRGRPIDAYKSIVQMDEVKESIDSLDEVRVKILSLDSERKGDLKGATHLKTTKLDLLLVVSFRS